MKKILVIASMLMLISLTGCGSKSGITKAEYEQLVSELEAVKEKTDELEKKSSTGKERVLSVI